MSCTKIPLAATALALGLIPAAARAADRYVTAPLEALEIEGTLPSNSHRAWWFDAASDPRSAMVPRVVLDGPGEAYVARRSGAGGANGAELTLVARVPEEGARGGRVHLARDDGSGMDAVPFRLPEISGSDAEATFRDVAASHFQHLADLGVPGAAWFRYRAHVLRAGTAAPDVRAADADAAALATLHAVGATPGRAQRTRDSELERTLGLFTGARAMAENLQLDAALAVTEAGERTVDVSSLPGITVEEVDWAPLVAGKSPEIDPLATRIPADQHALLFPSFRALVELVDEAERLGTPILRLLEDQAVDAATRRRYEAQLGLRLDGVARALGPRVVRSVAVTGSDPYLRTGSDVCVLLECAEPEAVLAFLAARRAALAAARPDAAASAGEVGGLVWAGLRSDDRAVCSYVLRDGDVVLVTNSPAQLERYAAVRSGAAAALASLPEMRFFRDRYPRGDAGETAFLYLSDATIRRWCSARWRIGASRRVRAQAAMAHEAARRVAIAAGDAAPGAPIDARIPATYGTLTFVTPIAELDLDRVTGAEAEAYRRFRNGYQRNWRGFFDPIAVRIGLGDGTIETDVTVMPMIEAADAREWLELTRGASLEPGDGDPHDGVLLHYVQAIDLRSDPVREARSLAAGMMPGVDPLSWVGDHVAFYVDDDPVFDEPRALEDPEDHFEEQLDRLPIALVVDVADPLKLAAFLTALRAFSEQAAPGVLAWETVEDDGRTYVKVTAREGRHEDDALSILYAITPGRLVVTPNEPLLRRALARASADPAQAEATGDEPAPWPGRHVAVRLSGRAGGLLEAMLGEWREERRRTRSWRNLFVLNEWRRRFPDRDPVEVHEHRFGQRLVCPGGGEYVWNPRDATMESTAYGHPGDPRSDARVPPFLASFADAVAGVTFEHDGLRARATLRRRPER